MKKIILLSFFTLIIFNNSTGTASADKPNQSDTLILSLMNEHIGNAVKDFYKDDSVRVQFHWSKNFDVIEVAQSEKGNNLNALNVVKIHIKAENNKKTLGVDTLTFGVTPKATGENNEQTKVKLLKYEHNDD